MKMKRNLTWLLIICLIFLGLILGSTNKVRANLFIKSTPESVKDMQLNQLMSALSKVKDPNAVKDIQEKLAPIEFSKNVKATAQAQQPVSIQDICNNRSNIVIQIPKLEMGILPIREDFLATQNLKINNIFRGVYQDQIVEVYAGKNYNADLNGLVVVSIESLNIYNYFYDSSSKGSLKIIHEKNLRLELISESGIISWFDIPAMQFVPSPNVKVNPVDLPPAPTAMPDPCSQFDTP